MSNRFEGKVAVITGAASGIGAATARRFAAEGARLVIADTNGDALRAVAAEIERKGGRAIHREVDVRSLEQVEAMTEAAVVRYGRLDIVFNNAGIGSFGKTPDLAPETWRDVLATDLDSVFFGTRAAIPYLREAGGGAIVNTASISGLAGDYGFAAYNAAKGAVVNYTKTAAIDHAREGIRVNCVCPGPIWTGLTDAVKAVPGLVEDWNERVPMGRLGTADEVAGTVLFLCSADASFITGEAIVIDGGLTACTGQPDFNRYFGNSS